MMWARQPVVVVPKSRSLPGAYSRISGLLPSNNHRHASNRRDLGHPHVPHNHPHTPPCDRRAGMGEIWKIRLFLVNPALFPARVNVSFFRAVWCYYPFMLAQSRTCRRVHSAAPQGRDEFQSAEACFWQPALRISGEPVPGVLEERQSSRRWEDLRDPGNSVGFGGLGGGAGPCQMASAHTRTSPLWLIAVGLRAERFDNFLPLWKLGTNPPLSIAQSGRRIAHRVIRRILWQSYVR